MIYKPTGRLYDTWVFYNEGTFFLYYLVTTSHLMSDGIGLATSVDGVHWQEHGYVIRGGQKSNNWIGSGMVWKSPEYQKNGKWICNYSEWRKDEDGKTVQVILFAESTDLYHWEKREDIEFRIDERWYDKDINDCGRWDCINVLTAGEDEKDGYFGYWSANQPSGRAIGFGRTIDGVHWEALPIPEMDLGSIFSRANSHEAASCIRHNGKVYLWLRGESSRDIAIMVSETGPEGPFTLQKKNSYLISNRSALNAFFPRIFSFGQLSLVNHSSITNQGYMMGMLKKLWFDEEDILRLAYWEGNEAAKGTVIQDPSGEFICEGILPDDGILRLIREDGIETILETNPMTKFCLKDKLSGSVWDISPSGEITVKERKLSQQCLLAGGYIRQRVSFTMETDIKLGKSSAGFVMGVQDKDIISGWYAITVNETEFCLKSFQTQESFAGNVWREYNTSVPNHTRKKEGEWVHLKVTVTTVDICTVYCDDVMVLSQQIPPRGGYIGLIADGDTSFRNFKCDKFADCPTFWQPMYQYREELSCDYSRKSDSLFRLFIRNDHAEYYVDEQFITAFRLSGKYRVANPESIRQFKAFAWNL